MPFVLQPIRKKERRRINDLYSGLRDVISDSSRKNGFMFIDHSSFFDGSEELFVDNVHVGDIGNDKIADALVKKILFVLDPIVQKLR